MEKAAREERSGGSLHALPNETLFFVDKSSDVSVVKKTAHHREKVLHSDVILERASLVPTLLAPKKKVKKGKSIKTRISRHGSGEAKEKSRGHAYDIWSAEDKNNNKGNANKKKVKSKKVGNTHHSAVAVEVDAPGCSYNPHFEDHQEALGLAVAQEMQKVYQKELEPPPIPRTVPGTAIDEEDVYFLEVGDDVEELSSGEDHIEGSRPIKVKKLTRADLNKKRRRKEQLKAQEQSTKRAKIQNDLLRLDEIKSEIENEQQDKQREWIRRTISKQEKQAQGPPRLGKLRYQPEPLQVLLSEEVTGSLRKLKGCYALAKERYNSLQRRGLIEPRLPGKRRARRKRVEFEQGSKGHKEREMHNAP